MTSNPESPSRARSPRPAESGSLPPWGVLDLLWNAAKISRLRQERNQRRNGAGPSTTPHAPADGDDDRPEEATPISPNATSRFFRVPDTVFVHHSRITRWYFTARDGTIKTKGRQKLTTANVIEHFAKAAAKRTGAARCIQTVTLATKVGSHDADAAEGDEPSLCFAVVEPEALHDLITSSSFSGLVQTFIEPRSESLRQGSGASHNAVAIANWTRNVLYVERRSNTNDMHRTTIASQNQQLSLEDRTTTDASSRFVRSGALSSTYTVGRAEQACTRIASEVELGGGGTLRVAGLVAYFKVDAADRLCLIACERVRTVDTASEAPMSAYAAALLMDGSDDDVLSASPEVARVKAVKKASPIQPAANLPPPCVVCRESATVSSAPGFSKVARRHVLLPLGQFLSRRGALEVKDVNASSRDACATGHDEGVPAEVRHLEPHLNAGSYARCSKSATWLDEPMSVCHPCVERLFRAIAPVDKRVAAASKSAGPSTRPSRPASQLSVSKSTLPQLASRPPRSSTPNDSKPR